RSRVVGGNRSRVRQRGAGARTILVQAPLVRASSRPARYARDRVAYRCGLLVAIVTAGVRAPNGSGLSPPFGAPESAADSTRRAEAVRHEPVEQGPPRCGRRATCRRDRRSFGSCEVLPLFAVRPALRTALGPLRVRAGLFVLRRRSLASRG